MTCHECGSDVAENDVFCPFCGISLEPVSLTDDQGDDSMANTILIQPSKLEALADVKSPVSPVASSVKEEMAESGDGTTDIPSGAASIEPSIEIEQPVVEKDVDAISTDDIPAPMILGGATKTIDNLIATSTSEYNLRSNEVDKITAIEDPPLASQNPPNVEDVPEILVSNESSGAQASESEVVPGLISTKVDDPNKLTPPPELTTDSQDEPTIDAAGPFIESDVPPLEVPETDAGEAIDEPESAVAAQVDTEVKGGGVPDEPSAAVNSTSNPKDDLFAARLPSNFEGIAKPSEEFESVDSYLSNSTFDSVRIMENRPPGRQDDLETKIHQELLQSVEDESASVSNTDDASAAIDVKESPSTAHNIGIGDTDGKRGSKLKPLSEGVVLNGRYEIVRKIGGGGMGAVYLASDNNLGGVLRAVKEMVQAHIEEEQQEKAINDFKRESMILSSLDHVSIPTIYDYFYDEKESRFYLVMKYISGGDLSSRLRSAAEGKIDEKSVTEWAIQIIDVLDYLHNQPSTIVYRDLKPSNIMIDGNSGRAMLIDFGIARSINKNEEKGVTAVGTMGYAPPELFSGNVEPRSDIYSLGSTMFHLTTGADPQSNPLLIFDFQKNPRPRQINPQLSDQIERILMKSVEYNADARFKSAKEMREVLEDHLVKLNNGMVTYGITEIPASVSLANQSVFCGFCGQRIVATDLFCAFCGAKQPLAQHGVHSEIYSEGAWTAKLVVEGTSELNAPAFSLQKDDNLLGRRDPMSNIFPEVDLSKYDPQTKISRRHARIWRDGNNFMVEDLGSSNGTILIRSVSEPFRLVPSEPQTLTAGDKIRVGDATLHFVIG